MRQQQISKQSFKIITQYGDMLVVRQGAHSQTNHHHHHHHHHAHHHPVNLQQQQQPQQPGTTATAAANEQQQQQPSRPIIMTFHDLGLNSELQFANFCESDEVKLMLQTFTMIHVNFIGQEFEPASSATPVATLPESFKYPTVEQMAECIVDICAQLRVRSFVGLGVGAGAYIVSTLALIRPDLVHGLFLINPVISSCSITEWLYFKMSAIASNHSNILHNQQQTQNQQSSGSISLTGSTGSGSSNQVDSAEGYQQSRGPKAGLKRIWNAVHHHHHHHHHQHQHQPTENKEQHAGDRPCSSASSRSGSTSLLERELDESGGRDSASAPLSSSNQSLGKGRPAAGSRLRNLILSRNFLHSKHQQQNPQMSHLSGSGGHSRRQPADEEEEHDERPQSSSSRLLTQDEARDQTTRQTVGLRRSSSVSGPGASNRLRRSSAGSRSSANSWPGKRPPFEYLMYHHFGSVSFQRIRRLSSDSCSELLDQANRSASDSPKATSNRSSGTQRRKQPEERLEDNAGELAASLDNHRASCDSSISFSSHDPERVQSHESLVYKNRRWHQRSSSVGLNPSYLASIASERQRTNYMQAVYRQYFAQLNSHNLWLFAQSFAKRKTLNLRKDCGSAAHAAAAAAALGTSICVAFAGLGPVGPGGHELAPAVDGGSLLGPATAKRKDSLQGAETSQDAAQAQTTQSKAPAASSTTTKATAQTNKPRQQQALIAGTKVKRTFTCQTLIMCSSVHIHRDRALKLMSLLNPLQATWIKTDQLIVLDEKPEKVCQAMRLFLQGIGYSMSTHERRLRLYSAQASISSADSNGSAGSAGHGASQSEPSTQTPSKQLKETAAAALQERAGKMST